ncbi:hypothetical protein [Paraburkholderia aromaticivorans]|uniref:hypothetical protein n=1 Tax=Paraburkholderia aromaticivorans TaxID=2026199 RepID=UPI0012FD1ECB|nr:hypothetical protein [Paraburkholderia aromaticivorans]
MKDVSILAIRFDVCAGRASQQVAGRPAGAPVALYGMGLAGYIAGYRSKGWAGDIFAGDDCLYSGGQTSEKSGRRIPVASHCD